MTPRTFYAALGVIGALIVATVLVSWYLRRRAAAEAAAKKYAASIQPEVTRLALLDEEAITLTKT